MEKYGQEAKKEEGQENVDLETNYPGGPPRLGNSENDTECAPLSYLLWVPAAEVSIQQLFSVGIPELLLGCG